MVEKKDQLQATEIIPEIRGKRENSYDTNINYDNSSRHYGLMYHAMDDSNNIKNHKNI